jgi:hypothetical protein
MHVGKMDVEAIASFYKRKEDGRERQGRKNRIHKRDFASIVRVLL